MFLRITLIALATTFALGCAHKVKVVTNPPGATVIVDGKKVGKSPTAFEEDVFPGSHKIEVSKQGYKTKRVEVQRTELAWYWIAGGIGGCVVCAGPACVAGAALANLSLCPAALGCLLLGNPGTILTIFAAPSVLTMPFVSIAALFGVSPLGLLALSEQSPDVIKISLTSSTPKSKTRSQNQQRQRPRRQQTRLSMRY